MNPVVRPAAIRAVAVLTACAVLLVALAAGTARGTPADHSVVYRWIEQMLSAIEQNPPAPTATTWRMYVVSSSMYDAWAAFDASAIATRSGTSLRRPAAEHTEDNKATAVSYAAHRALSAVFPAQTPQFDALMAELGHPLDDTTDVTSPAGIGNVAATAVVEHRQQDGSNAANGFVDVTSDRYPQLYSPVNSADPDAPNAPGGPDFDANRWQPLRVPTGTLLDADGNPTVDSSDPSTFVDQTFLTPHWGAVEPFALSSSTQFRPAPPPRLSSQAAYVDALGNVSTEDQAYRTQVVEVLDHSANLTDEKKVIAEFWADGPHTWTPPGHWNQLALGLSIRDGHSVDEDVTMFFALNGALLDAAIVAWEAKRHSDYVRPISAIRHLYAGQQVAAWGGPDMGTQMIDGRDWQPYQSLTFVTPPFAEYVSGHSTFSRSAREVLLAFTGTDALYDGVTRLDADYDGDGVEDLLGQHVAEPGHLMFETGPEEAVVLRWPTLLAAADEAGLSRRYGGIHFQDGDLRGREMGRLTGQQAYERAWAYWDPFGHLQAVVDRLVDDGGIDGTTARSLESKISAASRAHLSGNRPSTCGALEALSGELDAQRGKKVSEEAYQELSAELQFLQAQLCTT